MIYLVKTGTFSSSPLVVVSLISSLWSIVSKLVADDKLIVIPEARSADFKFSKVFIIDLVILLTVIMFFIAFIFTFLILVCGLAVVWGCCIWVMHNIGVWEMCSDFLEECWESMTDPYGERREQRELNRELGRQKSYKIEMAEAGATNSTEKSRKENGHLEWISWLYVLRFLWRFLDVSSLIFIRTLCWLIIGGTALSVVIGLEVIAFFVICVRRGQWELLYGIVSLLVIFESDEKEFIAKMLFLYRSTSNLILMILVTVWLTVNFGCPRCTDYTLRTEYRDDPYILTMLVFSWLSAVLVPMITASLVFSWEVFQDNASKSRDVEDMIETKNYDGILEMQLYNSQYGVYDVKRKTTLLMLAFQEQRGPIISHLLRHSDENEWCAKDANGTGILDHYLKSSINENAVGSSSSMIQNLLKLQRESNVTDSKGRSAFLCGCIKRLDNIIDEFQKVIPNIIDTISDPEVIFSYAIDKGNESVVEKLLAKHPLLKQHEKYRDYLSAFLETYLATGDDTASAFALYERDQNVKTRSQKMTVFLCAAYHGHVDLMRKLIEFDKSVLNDRNIDGYNAVSIAKVNEQNAVVEFLESKYNVDGDKPEKRYIIDRSRPVKKILLLGSGCVGKSTIFKQLRYLHGSGFVHGDRLQFKDRIYAQITEQMKLCMECIEIAIEDEEDGFEEGTFELSAEGKEAKKILLNTSSSTTLPGNSALIEAIERLWQEKAVRAVYDERATMKIEETSAYFWDEIQRVTATDYVPTDKDILLVRYRTTGVIEQKFEMKDNIYYIYDTGGEKSERKKWINLYDETTAMIYVASLNSYNEFMFEDEEKNKLEDSIELFGSVCNNQCFRQSAIVLFLNQKDLFAEKIKNVPITECPALSHFEGDTESYDETTGFIQKQFEAKNENRYQQIFTHFTCAVDRNNVEKVWNDIISVIINASLAQGGFIA